jgi:hypothetical protein
VVKLPTLPASSRILHRNALYGKYVRFMKLASRSDFVFPAKKKELEVADFALAVMASKRLIARNVIPWPNLLFIRRIYYINTSLVAKEAHMEGRRVEQITESCDLVI